MTGRPSKIILAAQEILKEYNSPITLRQLYYRFVAKGIIENSLNSYHIFIRQMSTARRDGRIPFSLFEDRTRTSNLGESPFFEVPNYSSLVEDAIDVCENADKYALMQLKQVHQNYDLPYWYNQPVYVEVWCEKEALANIFLPVTEKYGVTFVACKGYPSLSLLNDCAERFKTAPANREIHILYFGDFDMRGLNIQETVEKNLLDDFGVHTHVTRCALTKEQIETFQLPPSPAKIKDVMAKGWIEQNGDVAWELDALEPLVLTKIIDAAIQSQINPEILRERQNTVQTTRELMQKSVACYLENQQ
jgi:hypothetical protein